MAWDRPTLSEHITRLEGLVESGLGLVSPVLTRAVSRVVAKVIAAASHMLHGHIEYGVDQIFPQTQDEEHLVYGAELYGVERNAAEFATGPLDLTGTNGTVIPEGTTWVLEGREWTSDAEATIASGVATVTITAVEAGQDGNLDEGAEITLATPIAGVDSAATVGTGGISGGTDQEEVEDFRSRYIEARQEESLGGSDADYIKWAKEVAGVTRAWVYRHESGLGTLTVRFVRDDDADFIPDSGEVAAVQAKLDEERPTVAEATVAAPVAEAVNFTIALGALDTTANRAAIEAELGDLFFRNAEPGDGAGRGTIYLNEMSTAIGNIVRSFTLTTPSADYVPTLGNIAKVGTFTWS